MSNEKYQMKNEFYDALQQITAIDFINYLNEKNVTQICPMCGHDGEQIIAETSKRTLADLLHPEGDNKHSFVTYFRHDPAHPGDSPSNYYYKLTCDHCGFITTHAADWVLHWSETTKKNKEEDER
ncbi:hypothetical protein [Yersinia kristensenii]|uniref:hypothetical protein n=1 Tax=Yersinia kristensenii TaxID=28152 RepID=UPI0022FECCA5|nr:hypothetical protein [Yersinia kristensenii]MDA5487891.1 hypothetical protein [Yersinia kristensenii]